MYMYMYSYFLCNIVYLAAHKLSGKRREKLNYCSYGAKSMAMLRYNSLDVSMLEFQGCITSFENVYLQTKAQDVHSCYFYRIP